MMLNHSRQKITQTSDHSNVQFFHSSYAEAAEVFAEANIDGVDRVLLDLGLSSDQLADRERGFGFDAGGPLDMRFDTSSGHSAEELISTANQQQLESIFTEFGEENFARQIAAEICQQRTRRPIQTTEDLEACVMAAIPRAAGKGRNPATRVFQALRIAVNNELEHVQQMMTTVLPAILKPNGIAVILTFHSLEDRIVKSAFKGQKEWQALTKTPIESTPAEIRLNPRSRSAKLRAAMRRSL